MHYNYPIPTARGKSTQGAASPRVDGRVMMDTSHVKAKWAWLTFPVILLVGAVVLLWFTIADCSSGNVPLWKDNPLALLMHSDWQRSDGPSVLRTTKDLSRTSRSLAARYDGNVNAHGPAIVIVAGGTRCQRKGGGEEAGWMDCRGSHPVLTKK